MPKIYVIGSLRNPTVPLVGIALRDMGFNVYDDWYAGGPEADDKWQEYEKLRGRSYKQALEGYNAEHIFDYDLRHLREADIGVLVLPAGKSGHMELGWLVGAGKTVFVLFPEEPERFDVMYRFADEVFFDIESLKERLKEYLR